QGVEAVIRHRQARAVIEIGEIKSEGAVRLEVDEIVEDSLRKTWHAIGGKAHHFVLAGIDFEPGVIGKGRVKQTERMRKVNLLSQDEGVAAADPGRGRRPLANAVQSKHRRLIER